MKNLKEMPPSTVTPEKINAYGQLLMENSVATHASLLARLKDLGDQESWQEFYRTYHKLIYGFALKHGLTASEAEEVLQETVITVARNLPEFRYDPTQCSFKTWLFTLALWRIDDQMRKRQWDVKSLHRPPGRTDRTATVERVAGPEGERLAALWDEEWRKDLFERALDKVRPQLDAKQFQIFDLYALQGWSAREVARSLGVSIGQVYLAKHRVARLLAAEVKRLQRQTD
ncbi:MAG: sigma-70 family RNA polymerase sigma factor [Verrucomicrobia bacterium]|nr:sigma-70 family RNA polymerase sigma factor [Verrucomicrobiota bacterium]